MSASATGVLLQMFYDPKAAFESTLARTRSWLPLLAVTLGSAALLFWYFRTVDFTWLFNHMLAGMPDADEAQREAIRTGLSPAVITWGGLVSVMLTVPATAAMFGLYYLLAAKFVGNDIGFKKWFGFGAWIMVPRLLVLPLMALQIVSSGGQVGMEDLSMVTLNYLVLHLAPGHPWAGLAGSVDLTVLWTIALSVVGLRVWTGRALATCVTISLLPWLLIYGAWAAKIVAFS
ncbi:MAG: YIP1 family protein [Pseudomonadota bacterium]